MSKNKRTAIVGTLALVLFLLSLTLTNPGKALALDAFLKVSTITGESTDDKHKDWIEVLSWSFGDSHPATGTRSTGGARTAERTNFQDFKVVMRTSKASPKLFLSSAKGEHIPEVKLEVCKSSGDKSKFLEIKLSDAIVSSFVNLGNSAPGTADVYPTEEIMFNFGKIEVTYTEIDRKTGKPKGDTKMQWDLTANKGG